MSLASQLAEFVSGSRYQSLPTDAIAAAKVAVLDTLGVTLAGAREDSSRISADIVRQEGAREECSILGHGFRSSAQQAAFVNATSSHADDFDHSFAVQGQPTAPILAATLATAEAIGATGADVLVAYVAGFEVAGKLALAIVGAPEDGFHGAGFHANNSLGGLGATAACARLLELDEARVEMALGLAASMACGLRANFGTMAKPLHVGLAARSGVLAANLAARGFTASSSVFEGDDGLPTRVLPRARPRRAGGPGARAIVRGRGARCSDQAISMWRSRPRGHRCDARLAPRGTIDGGRHRPHRGPATDERIQNACLSDAG